MFNYAPALLPGIKVMRREVIKDSNGARHRRIRVFVGFASEVTAIIWQEETYRSKYSSASLTSTAVAHRSSLQAIRIIAVALLSHDLTRVWNVWVTPAVARLCLRAANRR